jgi:putative tryptophan/tyrosine transport system substrate-binding protein
MRRRDFITLIGGGATAWSLAARAQTSVQMRRMGALMTTAETDAETQPRFTAFRRELQKLGWTEDRNLRIDYRWAVDVDHIAMYASELVGLTPDVILVQSNPALAAVQQLTHTTPIVFVNVADPVGSRFIGNLARPGGNITGFTIFESSMGGKWLEILKEIAPDVKRGAVLLHPETLAHRTFLSTVKIAATSLGMTITEAGVHSASEIERAIKTFASEPDGALVVLPHPVTTVNRYVIIDQAAQNRLPAVYAFRYFATAGGLISYGIDSVQIFRRAAAYVDRILRGEKPGELPVQAADKFELAINLKTARALGLTVPPTLLSRADEVIE